MAKSYKSRLIVPIDGHIDLELNSSSGLLLARGYDRIVIGGRGPYVEFNKNQLVDEAFVIPKELEYRIDSGICYYIEYRSVDSSYVKLYFQKRLVSYADYKLDKFYISPFELYMNDGTMIIK